MCTIGKTCVVDDVNNGTDDDICNNSACNRSSHSNRSPLLKMADVSIPSRLQLALFSNFRRFLPAPSASLDDSQRSIISERPTLFLKRCHETSASPVVTIRSTSNGCRSFFANVWVELSTDARRRRRTPVSEKSSWCSPNSPTTDGRSPSCWSTDASTKHHSFHLHWTSAPPKSGTTITS